MASLKRDPATITKEEKLSQNERRKSKASISTADQAVRLSIDNELKARAIAACAEEHTTLSALVRDLLKDWLDARDRMPTGFVVATQSGPTTLYYCFGRRAKTVDVIDQATRFDSLDEAKRKIASEQLRDWRLIGF